MIHVCGQYEFAFFTQFVVYAHGARIVSTYIILKNKKSLL